ncbi:Rz1-like lysis system protein LysC [uncultured Desulfovibrio sp.]|uniref:Rz1-like lysis system protein LysC n=1 Tax=uncultured Desulfovibrio sp. TaxID=167968 RepID=UPI00272CE8EC|nr:Rz1-like lysis system protein LysC [uncultured Desulfovibrio sp.]
MRLCAFGMTILCLCLCPACSRTMEIPMPYPVRVTPPAHLLTPTPVPTFRVTTNGDLLEWALENREALRMCNADKEAAAQAMKGTE